MQSAHHPMLGPTGNMHLGANARLGAIGQLGVGGKSDTFVAAQMGTGLFQLLLLLTWNLCTVGFSVVSQRSLMSSLKLPTFSTTGLLPSTLARSRKLLKKGCAPSCTSRRKHYSKTQRCL